MKKNSSPTPNPSLKQLEILVGDWNMELSNASFLPNPSDIVKGHASFEWLEDGAFLMMYGRQATGYTRCDVAHQPGLIYIRRHGALQ